MRDRAFLRNLALATLFASSVSCSEAANDEPQGANGCGDACDPNDSCTGESCPPGGTGGDSTSGTGGTGTGGTGAGTGGAGNGTGGTSNDGNTDITGVETPTPPCTPPLPPAYADLPSNDKLPSPFTMLDGTPVATRADWACRRAELLSYLAEYELGPKPPKPASVTGSFSGSTLTIDVSDNGKSISFSVGITKPGGDGPFPAIIAYGGTSVPIPSGVATITFDNDDIAAQVNQSSRGVGKFYDLYGNDHGAGALMAWAWGVSRILDALETTPEAGIDSTRVGVTGCSRNGKGALVAGAFDARVALTLPQESGSGGSACWRPSDAQQDAGANVQTLSQIVTENVWFRTSFSQFGNTANKLPFDHHLLVGLVAPRGLLVIENTSMEWLGNVSCFTCATAGRRVFEALGVTGHMGFSQYGHGNHCSFPAAQEPEVTAYISKFLLDQDVEADVFKTDGGFTFDEMRWVDWETPSLP